ncbi:hypothetical protein [Algoriphagus namhaensis]
MEKLKKLALVSPFVVTLYSPKRLNYFYERGVKEDISLITQPSGFSTFFGFKNFLTEDLLQIYNIKSQKFYGLAPVSERSNFPKLDSSVEYIYAPVLALDKDKGLLYLTTTLDDAISVIDLNSKEVKNRI